MFYFFSLKPVKTADYQLNLKYPTTAIHGTPGNRMFLLSKSLDGVMVHTLKTKIIGGCLVFIEMCFC